ncbi:unnamed protein product [Brassica rapa subsp. trilocularis]
MRNGGVHCYLSSYHVCNNSPQIILYCFSRDQLGSHSGVAEQKLEAENSKGNLGDPDKTKLYI